MKQSGLSRSKEIEFKVAKTLFIMIAVFTASMLPHIGSNLIFYNDPSLDTNHPETFNQTSYQRMRSFYYVSNLILLYNSLWNFFIYQQRDSSFRNSLKVLRRRVFGKKKVLEPSPNRSMATLDLKL